MKAVMAFEDLISVWNQAVANEIECRNLCLELKLTAEKLRSKKPQITYRIPIYIHRGLFFWLVKYMAFLDPKRRPWPTKGR